MKRKLCGFIAELMAFVMLFTSIPFTSFAAETKTKTETLLPERTVSSEVIADGDFYLASDAAELKEGAETTWLLKVGRAGEGSVEQTVRLSMLDMTAKYGENYTVQLSDASLLSKGVQNADSSQSIKELLSTEEVEEYNYSDAVVEGKITAENQLTDEEAQEELEEFKNSLTGEKATSSDALKAGQNDTVDLSNLTLEQLKELQTGIASDKTPMTGSDSTGLTGMDMDQLGLEEYCDYLESGNGRTAVLEELNSAYLDITFKAGETEKFIEIHVIDNAEGNGDVQSQFSLEPVDESQVCTAYDSFIMTIIDDEECEPDTVSFSEAAYSPENGYITVVLERSGNLAEISRVMLDTESITAEPGVNYSEVHAATYFSFGMTKRTVKIPVVSTGLTEDVQFKVKIQEPVDCALGEISEAVCTVHPSDISFETTLGDSDAGDSDAGDTGEDSESGEDVLTIGEDGEVNGTIGLNSVIREDWYKLLYRNISQGDYPGCSSCYVSKTNSWELYLNRDAGAWASVTLDMTRDAKGVSAKRLDWSGFAFDIEKDNRPNIDIYNYYGEDAKDHEYVYTDKGGSSHKWVNTFYKHGDYPTVYKIEASNWHSSFKSGKTRIYWGAPIRRIFKISQVEAAPIRLIDKNGEKKNNTEFDEVSFREATKTSIVNGNEDGTYYMISGNTVTFSLKNAGTSKDRISYISALEMVNGDKSKVIWTANENEYPASAGFELTNDFLWQYKEYWTLKDNGDHGLYGDIQIRPVVKNYPVTIRVKEDDRCEYIRLWDGKDKEKDYTKSGDTRVYTYSRGDYIRYDAKLKEEYQVGYYWDGITVTYQGLANPKTYHITEAIPYVLEREMQYQTDVTMHIPMRDNEVVVRVSQDDWQLFDHDKGIFKEEYVKKDGYYYYTVEKDAGKIPFNVFQLSASLKEENKSMVPVWQEAFHSEKYAQDLYFFEGKEKKEENVVSLSVFYVNGGKELDSYIINGSIFYDTGLVGEETRTEGWYPATGAWAVAGTAAFGIADQKGNFSILRVNAAAGYYVKMRIGTGGIFVYRTVKLGSSMTIDSQRVVIRAYSAARPRFTQLNAYAYDAEGKRIEKPLQHITLNNQGSVLTTELLAKTTDYDLNGEPIEYTYNYSVEVGGKKIVKQATAVEKVTRVEFVVFDGKTHQEKSVYQTAKREKDGSWKVYNVFSVGKYAQYAAGDMLYARLITDRKIDDGQDVLEKIKETVYPPVNTGLVFAEEQRTDPELVDFKIPEEGKYRLPVLGSLTTQMNVRKLNLGVEATGDGGIRIYVGAAIRPQGSHYDSDGKPINDAKFRYNQENVLDGIQDMVKELNGGENSVASAPNGIGIPAWSFAPIAGLYLEFAVIIVEKSEEEEEGSNDLHHRLIGGGIYVGFMGSLRYTYYMLLGPVPAYVGGDVSVMMMLEVGVARTGTDNDSMSLAKLNQPFVNNLQNKVHFNFIYRANLIANAYAGVGICGTLGVRGGFSLNVLFLTNPTIKKQYPNYRSTGFSINGSIKFWVDALLCSIPIPTFVNHTWNFGYFKDIALKSDSEDGEEGQTAEAEKLEIISKYRPSVEADFTGNDTARKVIDTGDSVWEGVIKGRELVSGAYDDAFVRMVAVQTPSDAPKKVLMTYLEDNLDRNDNERTRLMYSVYTDNEEDGSWSEPVPVDADGAATADFSPSLCDRGDDVLITWISRKTPLTKESGNYAEQLKTLQVYTARYIKKTGEIKDVTQVTDDDYMYTNPKAIYDSKTGKTFLFYLKSEVSSDEITNGTDLINSVNPQTNEAEVAFRILDRENKEITEYYSYELPEDPQIAKAVKDALKGERFIPSEIEDVVKNPVVYDYDVVMADLARGDAPLCRAICKMAGIDYEKVEAGDEAACTAYDSYCENHAKEIEELAKEVKTYGVYAFVVDADNSLTTTADREIYVQLLDPATHKYSAPRKITDNEYGESSLKIVSDSRTSYLFWLEDGETTGISETEANDGTMQYSKAGRTVMYLDLSEVIDDSTEIPHTVSIGQLSSDGMQDGSSLTDYSVFADTQDNLFLFWREDTSEISTDKVTAEEVQQDIFVTALVRSEETGDAAWSDGVRLTNMAGVNNVPAVEEIDGQILMVSNNYVPDMTGTEIAIKKASLNETVFVPMGRMAASEVSVGKLPDQKGEKAELTVTFINEGNEPVSVKGFTYSMQLFDGETPVSDKVSGTAPGALNPQSRQYITKTLELTQDIQQTSNTLKLVASATTDGATITKELELGNDLPKYRFENIQVVQEGEQFHLTGKVLNTAVVDGSTEDVLIVKDTDYKEITRRPLSELENGSMQFEEMIPITDAIAELGRVELVLSVERDGKECSVKAYPRGYMAYPIGLKLNGSDSDQLKLKVGQSIVLNGEFKQSLYFGESSMLYSIDDSSSVATLNGNVLTANKAGTTRLSMTTRLFGGSKDVTVIVEENPAPDPDDPSGGGSGSVSTTPGGPASAVQLSGSWKQNADGTWSFVKSDGSAATGWGRTGYGSGTEYWHFNEKGIMDTGWYMDSDGSWYYLHETSDGRKGAMDRGWHFDTRDNKWYYLNPEDGKMKAGWVYVSGKWYYLSTEAAKPSWRKNAAGQWIYSGAGRAYGSMYANEATPDGYKVGADGAWIK